MKKSSSFSPWETPTFLNNKKSSTTKTKAIKKIQTFFKNKAKPILLPFINRVSANINDRINYSKKITKLFTKYLPIDNSNQCIQSYISNHKLMFKLGDNIILKYEIGSPSVYGIVYFGRFKNEKLFKFAAKLFYWDTGEIYEFKILQILTNAVFDNKCPHFPIYYAYTWCDKYNPNDILPELIIDNIKNDKKEFCILFNEKTGFSFIHCVRLSLSHDERSGRARSQGSEGQRLRPEQARKKARGGA